MINLQNVYLCVYYRKFTSVIKNISYDNSVPQFFLHDKFSVEEYLKKEITMNINKNEILYENFIYDFCSSDKNLVYILSEARKLVLIRNFEEKVIIKKISFPYSPINFTISLNSAYIVYLFKGLYII